MNMISLNWNVGLGPRAYCVLQILPPLVVLIIIFQLLSSFLCPTAHPIFYLIKNTECILSVGYPEPLSMCAQEIPSSSVIKICPLLPTAHPLPVLFTYTELKPPQ